MLRRPIRVANCSGFYGDPLAAAREMLAGPVDVLTEAAHLGVQRYELPNLRALNFVVDPVGQWAAVPEPDPGA